MAELTPEQINAIVETAVRAALHAAGHGAQPEDDRRAHAGRIDERYFRRVEKYGGEEKGWKEWSFSFKAAVGMANPKVQKVLTECERHVEEPAWDELTMDLTAEETDRRGAELYAVLTTLVSGEAMMILRGVPEGDGWRGWWKMAQRFDPKTPARALRSMISVMQPKKVKDPRDLAKVVEEWEVKIKRLKIDHDMELDDKILSALLISMLPHDLQDNVFQWTDEKTKFRELKDKVLAMALNRTTASRPTPMECDNFNEENGDNIKD